MQGQAKDPIQVDCSLRLTPLLGQPKSELLGQCTQLAPNIAAHKKAEAGEARPVWRNKNQGNMQIC